MYAHNHCLYAELASIVSHGPHIQFPRDSAAADPASLQSLGVPPAAADVIIDAIDAVDNGTSFP